MPDLNINIQNLEPALTLKGSDTFVLVDGLEGKNTTLDDMSEYTTDYVQTNLPASTTDAGVVELADATETVNGTDPTRAVTPDGLADIRTSSLWRASTSVVGFTELATPPQVTDAVDNTVCVTPFGLGLTRANPNWQASESQAGFITIVSQAELEAATDDTKAITALKLDNKRASVASPGIIPLASQTEVNTGTEATKAVTANTLHNKVASTTSRGLVEFATNAEAETGNDPNLAISLANLDHVRNSTFWYATTSLRGFSELATPPEVVAGTDNSRSVTPLGLSTIKTDPGWQSSVTSPGFIELADLAEVAAGVDDTRAVTPAGLESRVGDVRNFTHITGNNPPSVIHSFTAANTWQTVTLTSDPTYFNKVVWIMFDMPEAVTTNTTVYYRNDGDTHNQLDQYVCGRVVQNSIGSLVSLPVLLDSSGRIQLWSTHTSISIRLTIKSSYQDI